MGLVIKEREPWIAAFVDGLVSIRKHDSDKIIVCVLKAIPMCSNKNLVEAEVKTPLQRSHLWCC